MADQEEVAKATQVQDHLEVTDQEEAQVEIHLLSQTEGLVRIEIHRDQEVKHWV